MSASNKGPNVDYRLQNLTNALYLDGNDDVVVRTGFVGNIVISGNVNVPGTITVESTPDNPVHSHITEVGTSGILTVPYMPIGGNVAVTSLPAITGNVNANISGNVVVTSGNVNANVTGNVTSTITGNISGITSLPSITGNVTSTISGNISGITSLPAITGNVTSTITGNISGITSLPSITGNVNANVTGSVSVSSLPAISGNVIVTSLPAITGNVTSTITGNISGITSLPSVTGNVTSTLSGNLAGITGNVNVTQGTDPWQVEGNVTINQVAGVPTLVKYIDSGSNLQMDMVERLRVSPPTQSWWYAPTVDKDGDLRYIESNVGANSGSIFVQNLSGINLSSGTDSNGSMIRISRRRHKMRPGVSMLCAFSVNWNGYVPDGNVTKRVGMFTNYNGIFYEMTNDLQIVVRRRLTDGTLVEKRTTRANFNIDKLDGTGITGLDLRPVVHKTSAITAYVSKTAVPITGDGTVYRVVFTVADPTQFYVSQKGRITGVTPALYNGTVMVTAISGNNVTFVYNIDPGSFVSLSSAKFEHSELHNQYLFGFDFGGSRIGRVRFFMDGPAGRTAIHVEDFGAELSTPFSNAPAISTRYEIFNTGAPGRLPNLTVSSEVVNVEAEMELSPAFGVATNNTPVVYPKGGTATYPVLGVALRAGEPYQRSDLQLQGVTFADLANINQQNSGVFYWRLVLNPTIGGTVPASIDVGKSSRYWAYTAATTVTGGINLLSGYSSSTQQFDVRTALNFINLGSNIEYTDSDKIVLVVQQLVGGTADAQLVATINFIEAL